MLNQNITAERLFSSYRNQVEKSVAFYNRLQTKTPGVRYPTLAKKIWREGILAELWGKIATRLSGNKVDYLAAWREGRQP